MASGAGLSTGAVPDTGNVGLGAGRAPMETSSQKRPAPTAEAAPPGSPGAKRAVRREKVVNPATFPDVPHAQVVQEVQRRVLKAEADKAFYDNTYDQINDHADKLEKLKDVMHQHKDAMRKHIGRLDQTSATLEKGSRGCCPERFPSEGDSAGKRLTGQGDPAEQRQRA